MSDPDTLILYAFETPPGCFNMSPYCTKAEVLLKLADLPYQLEVPEDHKVFSKGKLPVLKDGQKIIEDSEFIRRHIETTYGHTLDNGLTENAKAIGHALIRTLEERTIFGLVTGRWIDDSGWNTIEPLFFGELPPEERSVVGPTVREQVSESVKANGFGQHSKEEQRLLLTADIESAAVILGDRDWFFSDHPTYLDAAIFGMLANFYAAPPATVMTELVAAHPNLVAYVERGMARWYPKAMTVLSASAA